MRVVHKHVQLHTDRQPPKLKGTETFTTIIIKYFHPETVSSHITATIWAFLA